MCDHGDAVILRVRMPADLSHTGQARWVDKPIDRCITSIVQALTDAGIWTANSCCGHGMGPGSIVLHDGRELVVKSP